MICPPCRTRRQAPSARQTEAIANVATNPRQPTLAVNLHRRSAANFSAQIGEAQLGLRAFECFQWLSMELRLATSTTQSRNLYVDKMAKRSLALEDMCITVPRNFHTPDTFRWVTIPKFEWDCDYFREPGNT